MIILRQPPPPNWGRIPNMSPFCVKLETFLKMAQLPYKTAAPHFKKAPTQKIPYIEIDGQLIGDSGLIIDFLTTKFSLRWTLG